MQVTDKDLKLNGFTILEAKHGLIVLNINHSEFNNKEGNVYVSDYTGTRFSLSLEHNARDDQGFVDFVPI